MSSMQVSFSLEQQEQGNFMCLVYGDGEVVARRKIDEPKRISGSRVSYGNIGRVRSELCRLAAKKGWVIV